MALVTSMTWDQIFSIPSLVVLYLVGCIVLLPLDRFYDDRFRKLEKLRDDTTAA